MNDKQFIKELTDRFEGFELVEYLDISVEAIVDAFEDVINENREDLEEFLGVNLDVEDQYE